MSPGSIFLRVRGLDDFRRSESIKIRGKFSRVLTRAFQHTWQQARNLGIQSHFCGVHINGRPRGWGKLRFRPRGTRVSIRRIQNRIRGNLGLGGVGLPLRQNGRAVNHRRNEEAQCTAPGGQVRNQKKIHIRHTLINRSLLFPTSNFSRGKCPGVTLPILA